MPTEREREYYRMGFADGVKVGGGSAEIDYSTRESTRTTIRKVA